MSSSTNYSKGTTTRVPDKKISTISTPSTQPPQTQINSNSNTAQRKGINIQDQSMKKQSFHQESDQEQIQNIVQEQTQKVKEELIGFINQNKEEISNFKNQINDQVQRIQTLEGEIQKLQQQNKKIETQQLQELDKKIETQQFKLQELDKKIETQQFKLQELDKKIEKNDKFPERILKFIQNNEQAHETWKLSSEKIEKVYSSFDEQFQELNQFKQQIEQKVMEYNSILNQNIQNYFSDLQQKILTTQAFTDQNLFNIAKYEDTVKKFCEEINKYYNYQEPQVQNFNFNNQTQPLPQDFQQQYNLQQISQQPNYNNPIQYQQQMQSQSYNNTTLQNDFYSQPQQISYIQEQPAQMQMKSKIKLISQTQGPTG
ncbi:unnamed protein product [Paramecium sonneborni]|uniref:Uncharacterized protein n=1 Tax=Paramecium sonneborni TaxID=65129 RepID=A0A8S1PJF6_9CILI|nr:unnamed protein product [Paramecium sonneborni]